MLIIVVILPLLIALLLYSAILTNDLFGDEFDEYGFSALDNLRFSMSTRLDVHTQLARLGYILTGEPWGIRLYSLFCALCTIALVGKVAHLIWDRRIAAWAILLTVFSPWLIEFAVEARPNSIFIFAGTLFLYALLRFMQNDSWPNTLLLIFSACFGLLAREMFVAILIFGCGYYVIRYKRITFKLGLVPLAAVPFLVRMCCRMSVYSHFAPKEPSGMSASVLNFLLRLPMAFTYGYCTLNYPERDAGWNISIGEVLLHNLVTAGVAVVVFCIFLVGIVQLFKKARSQTLFLIGALAIPILIMLVVQETGFSMLNEKHVAGVAGAYYVLLAAIMVHISRFAWGKCAIGLYAYLVALSLFHFYFQPEIYSRRSNFTALNSYLTGELEDSDLLIGYHLSREREPNYLTILDKTDKFVDLYLDKPAETGLIEYVSNLHAACTGKIYLIYDSRLRPMVDPANCVLPFLKKHHDVSMKHYGRNLLLYEFSEKERESKCL
jgi:hypothetical protein